MSVSTNQQNAAPRFGLRLRRDLLISAQSSGGKRVWVVKDPVSFEYFRFRAEEYCILQLLDGRRDLDEIKSEFDREFAPRRMTVGRLQAFLASLYANGLLISDSPQQGEQLFLRHRRRQSRTWLSAWQSILAIRFRGINPERLLNWLEPKCRFLFTRWSFAAALLLMISALVLVAVHWEVFLSKLPDAQAFVSTTNLIWLVSALAFTKVLHEFGHALTCKHYGGECHEMGVMLLVFTPCLYCDVSDCWMLPSKWKRMAITAAGIWVELTLAAICTFLWWFSQPGLLNTICLNVMVVCTVGTVLINGNPLLRYDGYYLLSDFWDAPNLWQDSRSLIRQTFARWFAGAKSDDLVMDQRRIRLFLYGVASVLYRGFVLVAILLFLYRVLTPLGLQALAYVFTASIVMGLVIAIVVPCGRFISNPVSRSRIKPIRLAVSGVILAAALFAFFAVPLPCHVPAPVVLEPHDAQVVYVPVRGTLVSCVSVGDRVTAEQTLARLENPELAREVVDLSGRVERQRTRVRNLEILRVADTSVGGQLPAAKELLADLEEQLNQKRRQQSSLELKAPRTGMVLPLPRVSESQRESLHLRSWVGSPLDERNVGCTLQRSTPLCQLGTRDDLEAVLIVDQSDLPYVRLGQQVRVRLDLAPGRVLTGMVTEIARRALEVVPKQLAAGQEIAHQVDSQGIARPLDTLYQVRVAFDPHELPLIIDARGRGKIQVEGQTLATRVRRFLARTFKPL